MKQCFYARLCHYSGRTSDLQIMSFSPANHAVLSMEKVARLVNNHKHNMRCG